MALLHATNLTTEFKDAQSGRINRACDNISFEVNEAEVVGLVGESGCGKSTLGRTLVGLETPKSGRIDFDGHTITSQNPAEQRKLRRRMQYVFQDSLSALEPRQDIGAALHESLIINGERNPRAREARIAEILKSTNLSGAILSRKPRELSGGQRQRICIARALLVDPKLIICDEPVSSLDVSLRAQVMNLFLRLRDEFGVAIILIAHDLAVVRQASARVHVMYLGRIVEFGPSGELYAKPKHPYTQALISAILGIDPQAERQRQRILLKGELPSPFDRTKGCRFRSRCPSAIGTCAVIDPSLDIVGNRAVACHVTAKPY